jgi:hypothetical protein
LNPREKALQLADHPKVYHRVVSLPQDHVPRCRETPLLIFYKTSIVGMSKETLLTESGWRLD